MAMQTFSIPANDGTAGHPTTQISVFIHVPAAPNAETCVFDVDLSSGHYFRLGLGADLHLRLTFSGAGYGSATADLGSVALNTWTWVSCGFSTAGGLHIRGDVTPAYSGTTTTQVLVSSGTTAASTQTNVPFGWGVPQTSSDLAWPNNPDGGWLMSKGIMDQIAANAAAGNPRPMPSTDFALNVTNNEYLAHDALGPAALLTDSGTAGLHLFAGGQGLTIVTDGPALQPLLGGPAGPHEGDINYFHLGAWSNLHAGTDGQELTMAGGYPAWTDQPAGASGETIQQAGTVVGTRAVLNFVSGATVADNPTAGRVDVTITPYTLPTASSSVLGGIKVGAGLAISGSGVLSVTGGSGGVGTVTSVALAAPAQFTVSGSPVTSSGTLTLAWATQSANRILAGPASGSAAAPTFRALVPVDLNSTAEGDIITTRSGAISVTAVGAQGTVLMSNGSDPGYDDVVNARTRWEPLTNQNVPDLIFDSTGDVIMVTRSP